MKKALLVLSAIAALALVSCGGGAGGDPDKSDPAPTPSAPKTDLVLTYGESLSSPGTLEFAKMTDYPEDFNISDYEKVTFEWEAGTYGEGKICLNSTKGDNYNGGYGDGFGPNYIHNFTPDANNICTLDIALTAEMATADCITFQDFSGSGSVKITKVTFFVAK